MNKWKEFCQAFSNDGGGLVLLTVILLALYPMMWRGDLKAWETATFILGCIATLLKSGYHSATTTTETTDQETGAKSIITHITQIPDGSEITKPKLSIVTEPIKPVENQTEPMNLSEELKNGN